MGIGYRSTTPYRSATLYTGVVFQLLRPNTDTSAGSWTVGPLYDKIDETVADDADFMTSPANPQTAACKIKLANASDPGKSNSHVVRYRFQKNSSGGQVLSLTVRLLQGNTTIASTTHTNVANGFTLGTFTLSGAEADSITNYADLYLQFEANGS